MRTFRIRATPRAIRHYLWPMGSLRGSLGAYINLHRALSDENKMQVNAALERLAAEAVPVVGNPHPQRASVYAASTGGLAMLETPAGVGVHFVALDSERLSVIVLFRRDSKRLAGAIGTRVMLDAHRWEKSYYSPITLNQLKEALDGLSSLVDEMW